MFALFSAPGCMDFCVAVHGFYGYQHKLLKSYLEHGLIAGHVLTCIELFYTKAG